MDARGRLPPMRSAKLRQRRNAAASKAGAQLSKRDEASNDAYEWRVNFVGSERIASKLDAVLFETEEKSEEDTVVKKHSEPESEVRRDDLDSPQLAESATGSNTPSDRSASSMGDALAKRVSEGGSAGPNRAKDAGIAVAVLAIVAIMLLGGVLLYRRYRKNKPFQLDRTSTEKSTPEPPTFRLTGPTGSQSQRRASSVIDDNRDVNYEPDLGQSSSSNNSNSYREDNRSSGDFHTVSYGQKDNHLDPEGAKSPASPVSPGTNFGSGWRSFNDTKEGESHAMSDLSLPRESSPGPDAKVNEQDHALHGEAVQYDDDQRRASENRGGASGAKQDD